MRLRLAALITSLLLATAGLATAFGAAPASAAGVQVIPVPTSSAGVGRIVTAPNGVIWFAEEDAQKVGRLTPDGQTPSCRSPAKTSTPA